MGEPGERRFCRNGLYQSHSVDVGQGLGNQAPTLYKLGVFPVSAWLGTGCTVL